MLCFFAQLELQAAEPQPVKSYLQEYRGTSWYAAQVTAWQKVIDQNPQNEKAWFNLYNAMRLSGQREKLPALLAEMKRSIPGTPTEALVELRHNSKEQDIEPLMRKVEKTNPQHPILLKIKFFRAYQSGAKEALAPTAHAWYETGYFDAELLAFAHNMLMSVEPNAVLLTFGDADTFPVWILQYALGVRKDVRVLNIHTLETPEDRKVRGDFLRLSLTQLKPENLTPAERIEQIVAANPDDHFYTAITMPAQIGNALKKPLWLTGLASFYGDEKDAYQSILRKNWEEKFLLDHLRVPLSPKPSYITSVMMSANYLIPMTFLQQYYESLGEPEKVEALEHIVQTVAERSGQTAQLNALRKKTPLQKPQTAENYFDANPKALRAFEKHLMKVGDKLFAYDTEVSNKEYHAFLRHLKASGETEKYEAAKPKYDKSNPLYVAYHWDMTDLKQVRNQTDYAQYPIVNITREGVKLYLEWLNTQYRETTQKKRYENVTFRLPKAQEWLEAAKAGKNVKYPWGGPMAKNGKGCYLGNFKVEKCECASEMPFGDGFSFTSPVAAYFPNDYGLYDVSGNVWEMGYGAHLTHGGSWNDAPENATCESSKEFKGASPEVGFRIFMDVSGTWKQPLLEVAD